MIESNERVQEFKDEIDAMKVRDPSTGRDRVWLRISIAMLVVGIGITIVAYIMSHGTSNPLAQNDAIILGLIGVAVSVVGGAVFLRYSLASFLRFWLARFVYEQHVQTDRIVEKLDR